MISKNNTGAVYCASNDTANVGGVGSPTLVHDVIEDFINYVAESE
jgi:hypothetical protein